MPHTCTCGQIPMPGPADTFKGPNPILSEEDLAAFYARNRPLYREPAIGTQHTPSEQAATTCNHGAPSASAADTGVNLGSGSVASIVSRLRWWSRRRADTYAGRAASAQRALDILAGYPGLAELIDILADLDL